MKQHFPNSSLFTNENESRELAAKKCGLIMPKTFEKNEIFNQSISQ